jgi:hypothetical protein
VREEQSTRTTDISVRKETAEDVVERFSQQENDRRGVLHQDKASQL